MDNEKQTEAVERIIGRDTLTQTQVDAVAAAIAKAANADYWTDEISDWENSEEWEREAHPDEQPWTAYEDREEFRKQARAALRAANEVGTR